MDISELQLKINKNKAVNDLKAVEGQLGKTGEAADGLINTLKDIGLTVGFSALVKETLQINNELKALDNRMSAIFGKNFDASAIRNMANDLNISNNAAKSLLATIGQFAQGMGQSSQFVRQFSTDLTKAAVDYGTFMGKTSTQDFSDIARKFAKATLGEVGELKEIGIVIDTNSESFKNYVKQIQEATGASEAQARQQAITNELLAQVEKTSGSASKNMFDGWTQLNRLMDEFKNVLGGVGEIFSSVLGPVLKVLSDIVSIPFVQSTLSWTIAIGGVVVGYTALMKILGKISNLLNTSNTYTQLELGTMKKVFELQQAILKTKERQVKIQQQINALQVKTSSGPRLFERDTFLNDIKASNAAKLDKLNNELKSLDQNVLAVLPKIGGLDEAFIEHLSVLGLVSTGLKSTTASTLAATAAELKLADSRKVSVFTSIAETLTKINQSIPNLVGGMGKLVEGTVNFIKTGKFAPGMFAKLGAGLKACLVPLAAIVGKLAILAAVFVIVHDLIRRIS